MKDYCYYFCWCTWMFSDELHRYWPEAEIVCKGYLANHKVLWMDASGRGDRGWCHLDNGTQSWGNTVEGTIAKVPMKYYGDWKRMKMLPTGRAWTVRTPTPDVPESPLLSVKNN